jgi:hypothetical protein
MTDKNDNSICPLCNKLNRCDVNASSGCWCMNSNVPQALLATVPAELKGISCVCNNCIEGYYQQQRLKHNGE